MNKQSHTTLSSTGAAPLKVIDGSSPEFRDPDNAYVYGGRFKSAVFSARALDAFPWMRERGYEGERLAIEPFNMGLEAPFKPCLTFKVTSMRHPQEMLGTYLAPALTGFSVEPPPVPAQCAADREQLVAHLRALVAHDGATPVFSGDLAGYAAAAAAKELIENWEAAILEGAKVQDLPNDVSAVIKALTDFQSRVRTTLQSSQPS